MQFINQNNASYWPKIYKSSTKKCRSRHWFSEGISRKQTYWITNNLVGWIGLINNYGYSRVLLRNRDISGDANIVAKANVFIIVHKCKSSTKKCKLSTKKKNESHWPKLYNSSTKKCRLPHWFSEGIPKSKIIEAEFH